MAASIDLDACARPLATDVPERCSRRLKEVEACSNDRKFRDSSPYC